MSIFDEVQDSDHDIVLKRLASYWNEDAATYDAAFQHGMGGIEEQAAWMTALRGAVGRSPKKILDVGCGTGFLSIPLARMGHDVTAADISGRMIECVEGKAAAQGLRIDAIVCSAEDVEGEFDVVVSRHLLWTLPGPISALRAWRAVATRPGRLALFDSTWGVASRTWKFQAAGKTALTRLGVLPAEHHAAYGSDLTERLPLVEGYKPGDILHMLQQSGWDAEGLVRLRDVEWARRRNNPLIRRIAGVPSPYLISAH